MKKLVLLFLMISLSSCGIRKTAKTVISEKEKTETITTNEEFAQVETNVKIEVTTIENKEDSSVTEVTTITPVDAAKPAYFSDGGENYNLTNAYFKKERTIKISKNNKMTDHIADIGKKVNNSKTTQMNNSVVRENRTTDKQTERENSINWLFLFIPILLLLVLFWIWKKYKDSFWFV